MPVARFIALGCKKNSMPMSRQDSPWSIQEADFPDDGSANDQLRFPIGYAILAPSSHNTQPWEFRVEGDRIDVFLDCDGWLKVADDDQRQLHISVGCALENLLVAAEHFGCRCTTSYLPDPDDPSLASTVVFENDGEPSPFRPPELFDAITLRHTNHHAYKDRPVPADVLERLRGCSTGDLWLIGLLWLLMTAGFEFLFFHFGGGKSWPELLADDNLPQGRIWLLVLATTLFGPPTIHAILRRKTDEDERELA